MSVPALGIETSQRVGGVALRDHEGRLDVEMLRSGERHDDDLLAAIDRLTRRAGVGPRELGLIGVCVGPGGFTGLRIAVSTAMMLSEATGAVVVPVPAALVVAQRDDGPDDGPLLVALAVKGETFWATVVHRRRERGDPTWQITSTPAIVTPERLTLDGLTAVIGDRYLPAWVRRACGEIGLPIREPRFDPAAVLVVAERDAALGRTIDPVALRPIYPRPPEAVRLWRERR